MIMTYRDKVNRVKGKQALIVDQLNESNKRLVGLNKRLVSLEQALVIIQEVAKKTQEQLVYHIEDVVNTALDACFPDEYTFKLLFEIKRNKTEGRLVFYKNGFEINPMDASGGGVVDVASFALRIAAWSLGRTNNVIVLDESFKFLSRDLQPRAGEILKEISVRLGIQFIMVSHIQDIIESADRVFEIVLNKGESVITRQD